MSTQISSPRATRRSPLSRSAAFAALVLACGMLAPSPSAASSAAHIEIEGKSSAPSGAANLCQTYQWACRQGRGADKVGNQALETIVHVNRTVNGSVRYLDDQKQFNAADHWSLPTARGGDCEDFALLKKKTLLKMGFPPQSLLIATVLDGNRLGHAVLVVRTAKGDLVLDNATDRVLPWSETGYVFLRMQNPKAPSGWVRLTNG